MNGNNFLTNTKLLTKPDFNDVELCVFGRGFGECVLIHCGNHEFIVIDSFINPDTGNPIVLDYLKSLDIPSTAIKKIVITHWHQDHISGICELINNAAENVKIILSPIVSEKNFLKIISYSKQQNNKKADEFNKLLELIKQKKIDISFANNDKRIFALEEIGVELFCLSPSDKDIAKYLKALYESYQDDNLPYEFHDENELSIVLLFKFQNDGILLGSDLEISKNEEEGWKAIAKDYNHSLTRPSVFKIPHHGSQNGHCDDVWNNILADKPISILTVYNKGKKLPTDKDIERIKSFSKEVYICGKENKPNRELKQEVRKIMPRAKIESISSEIGIVRYRKNLNRQDYLIESFGAVRKE